MQNLLNIPQLDLKKDPILPGLLVFSLIELLIYRIMVNLEVFAEVGYSGELAYLANAGLIFMVATGICGFFVLIFCLSDLINRSDISGFVWRTAIILISPLFLITLLWSIWSPLFSGVLALSLVGAFLSIVIVITVIFKRPVSIYLKLLFMLLCLSIFMATTAWFILDFVSISRLDAAGKTALKMYQFSEALYFIVPAFLFFFLCFESKNHFQKKIKIIHIPALTGALITTVSIVWLFLKASDFQNFLVAPDPYLVRFAYRTFGISLSLPFYSVLFVSSVFFVTLTALSLIISFKGWKTKPGDREMGYGLLFIYIAGLVPISVYLYTLTLVGVFLFAIGLVNRSATSQVVSYQDFNEISEELDNHCQETKRI